MPTNLTFRFPQNSSHLHTWELGGVEIRYEGQLVSFLFDNHTRMIVLYSRTVLKLS